MMPTKMCKAMNEVYNDLKTMTIDQIEECRNKALNDKIRGKLKPEIFNLYDYQCLETIRRKKAGEWE
jgi:hypothetical protein